jgi:outer membrane protein assembly factor BamB
MRPQCAAGRTATFALTGLALIAPLAGPAAGAPAGDASTQPAAGIGGCEVTTPTGEYALAILDFAVPGVPGYEKWAYLGGLRAGKMRMDDKIGISEPGGWLELKNGKLAGTFRRSNSEYGRRLGFVQVTVDAAVSNGSISGTAQIGDKKGTISGKLIPEAELAKKNAVAKDKNWPCSQGPANGGCSAQPAGAATIDSPNDIRVVWRAEESDIGQGMSPLTRFMQGWGDASTLRTSSGCGSPIVADGRLFFRYYRPSPKGVSADAGKGMLAEAQKAGIAGNALPAYAAEKIAQATDDIVVCMDAATGKTLWKAVMKERGVNSQHHKGGPFDMSPAVGEGKVFSLGMSGCLYAFDAATGKPLWEVQLSKPADYQQLEHSTALQVAGGVVASGHQNVWTGFDVHTGRIAWKSGDRSHSILTKWVKGTQEFLIGAMGSNVVCLEAKTGKEAWRLPVGVISGGRGLGPGGITVMGDRLIVYQSTGPKDEKGRIAVYNLSPGKADKAWEADGGCQGESIPVAVLGKFVFSADLRVMDLASGKVLGQSKGPVPSNGGFIEAIEDLVLVRIDGTHGGIGCGWYKVSGDGAVRLLGEWSPPVGGGTTSYHHPIFYPMVDGRMFLRQYDGVYCWDLRKPGVTSK